LLNKTWGCHYRIELSTYKNINKTITGKPKLCGGLRTENKLKLKRIRISGSLVAIIILIYILLGFGPYMGRAYVSTETRNAFAMQNFFGEYESPERVMLLESPDDAFFHRLNLISNAREQIIFSTFAFHPGEATDIIVGALLSAADRGVEIHFMYNAIGSFMRRVYINALSAHENISFYSFSRWQFFRPQYLNTALHDKYMIVDGSIMILGGRNISDRYFDLGGFNGNITYDREVLVYNSNPEFKGSIVDVVEYFNVKRYSGLAFLHDRGSANEAWKTQKNNFVNLYVDAREGLEISGFDYYANTVRVNNITLVTNPIGFARNDSMVAYNLLMLAKNSDVIVAQSPYVTLTHRNLRILTEAVQGKDVTLITNSLSAAVNLPSFSSYHVSRRRLLNAGITIYEFQSINSSLHGKTYLFDGRLTAIGSFNMNERSIRSDTESMLIIDSEEFHDIVLDAIRNQMSQSLRVAPDGSYAPCNYVEEAHVSLGKRALYTVAGYVLRIFRFMF